MTAKSLYYQSLGRVEEAWEKYNDTVDLWMVGKIERHCVESALATAKAAEAEKNRLYNEWQAEIAKNIESMFADCTCTPTSDLVCPTCVIILNKSEIPYHE